MPTIENSSISRASASSVTSSAQCRRPSREESDQDWDQIDRIRADQARQIAGPVEMAGLEGGPRRDETQENHEIERQEHLLVLRTRRMPVAFCPIIVRTRRMPVAFCPIIE
jgi:hypothetical protein